MNKRRGFISHLSQAVKDYRSEQRTIHVEAVTRENRAWLRWLGRRMVPNFGTLLVVAVLVLTQRVWAKPVSSPATAPGSSATIVNYQGRLADNAGNPLDGNYGMIFSLWDAPTGGSLVWGPENHTSVPVSDGLFNVGLGSQTAGGIPVSVWDGDRYLEITIDGETLSPRELIRSVPIAGLALTVPDGAISTSKLSPGTVVNRYEIEWFGDETPCTTDSTTYVDCGVTLGGGFANAFPLPRPGTIRHYHLMVAKGDNLSTTGTTYVRVIKRDGGAVVYEFDTQRDWSWSDYQVWRYSGPIVFDEPAHLELQIRLTEPSHTMWLYRVWVMAEDVVP